MDHAISTGRQVQDPASLDEARFRPCKTGLARGQTRLWMRLNLIRKIANEGHPNLRRNSREGMRSPKPQTAVAADACPRPSPEDDKGGSGSHQVEGSTGLTRHASGRRALLFPVDGHPSR